MLAKTVPVRAMRLSELWPPVAAGLTALIVFGTPPAFSDPGTDHGPGNRLMVRFELDNDVFVNSDDAYSAGWSLQFHSPLLDNWGRGLSAWVGRVPGLGDDGDGGRVVRWAAGLSQQIFTPHAIWLTEAQPNDVPWAGILGLDASLSSYDNDRLAALQVYLGCMGPCSRAEQVHRFIHEDLHWGDRPAGWTNQLANQALGNVNYEYRRKVLAADASAYAPGHNATDVAVGGQVGLGNLATFVEAQIELRFGRNMPMGFTPTPDPAGLGVVTDPLYIAHESTADFRRWSAYVSVITRYSWYERLAPAEGGRTENGGHPPGFDANQNEPEVALGVHLARFPVAFHATYYRYIGGRDRIYRSYRDWVNMSLDVRF